MKKSMIFYLLGFTILNSCAKKTPLDNRPGVGFPGAIGTTFVYAVTDSLTNTKYDVKVTIAGKTTMLNGLPVTVWIYRYPNSIDTNYVFSNKDSVVFYGNRQTDYTQIIIKNVYHFPLAVGNKWKQSFISDSSHVTNMSTVNSAAGTFQNAFLINETGYSYNYVIRRNQWVTPNIGIIKQTVYERNLGYITSQSWELISYTLK